ncbi:MAG: 1-acyl-sn-glycerol-3-phosphate acyltransferase, partial [Paludibacteraceae bacterium]|nr:1-acyl-sn-glycerol-3-phosphate acyltransferase [Paludibacteraceae bacterium]
MKRFTHIDVSLRHIICVFFRTILHWRYDIKISGMETFDSKTTFLIFPNHLAVIDPIILFSELHKQKIQPLVDEVYFKNPIFRKILSLFKAICVPDLGKSRKGIEQVRQLQDLTLQSLKDGKNVLFY